MKTITIVGGGLSGLAALSAIREKLRNTSIDTSELHIILANKTNSIGPGLAYSTNVDGHIINMPAHTMGFSLNDKSDFIRWCFRKGHVKNMDVLHYPPRHIYGTYLKDVSNRVLQDCQDDYLKVSIIQDEVTSISSNEEKFNIVFSNHSRLISDYVLMAIGNQPSTNYSKWTQFDTFIPSPWSSDELCKIPKGENVVILGTSLTAIDTVRTLSNQGHQGKITLVSRKGLLPRVQSKVPHSIESSIEVRLLDLIENSKNQLSWKGFLREILDTIDTEVGTKELFFYRRPSKSALELLEEDMKNATKPIGWQNILGQTTDCIEKVWNALPKSERNFFDEQLLTFWMINRHSMPFSNAAFIRDLMATGTVEILGLENEVGQSQIAEMSFEKIKEITNSEWVINATNGCNNIELNTSPILKSLIQNELIHPHPNGGITVNFNSFEALAPSGKTTRGLYVFGQLTRGTHFYTNAAERNIDHAHRIADSLINELTYGHIPLNRVAQLGKKLSH